MTHNYCIYYSSYTASKIKGVFEIFPLELLSKNKNDIFNESMNVCLTWYQLVVFVVILMVTGQNSNPHSIIAQSYQISKYVSTITRSRGEWRCHTLTNDVKALH